VEAAQDLRPLEPGTMLDDKYRVDRLLAVGGMGAVYEGTHTKLRKRVAIKVLNQALASQAMIDRFHREAITASQIGHEGIAQVTDLGQRSTGESFIVMELLEGEPLAARFLATKQFPIDVACELGCSILSPLAAAHAAGVVHRDLKPDNVFLVRQSRGELVKLLDFGISRATGLEGEFKLTTTGLVLGTPYYMSPEQARGETANLGPSADLYSFGVIMYEMLVGEVPIKADNYNQLMYRVMTGDYARPRSRRPDIPPALEDIVLRAMALDPTARPRSATELEQTLLQFCRPTFRDHMIERISANQMGFKSSSPLLPSPTPAHARTGAPPAKKFSKVPIVIAVLGAIGIAAAVIVAKQNKSTEEKPAPAPVVAEVKSEVKPVEPPAPAVVPVVEKVVLTIETQPADATITIDGKVVTSPIEVDKADTKHELVITKPGFTTFTNELSYTENAKLVVNIEKIPPKGAKPPPKQHKPAKPGKNERIIDTQSPYGK
jgi:eukaryotic-like serine/threonine-protein kinase